MFPGMEIKDILNMVDQTVEMITEMKKIGEEFEKTLGEVTPIIGHPEGASTEDKINALVRMQGVQIAAGARIMGSMAPMLEIYTKMMTQAKALLEEEMRGGEV